MPRTLNRCHYVLRCCLLKGAKTDAKALEAAAAVDAGLVTDAVKGR